MHWLLKHVACFESWVRSYGLFVLIATKRTYGLGVVGILGLGLCWSELFSCGYFGCLLGLGDLSLCGAKLGLLRV
jgi:hypothetical protein